MEEDNCSGTLTSASSVVLASLNGVSGFLTITGNSVILLVLYRTPSLKTVSNYFVGSLACADLSVGLFANSLYVALSGFVSLQEIQELKNAETFVWLLTTTVSTFNLCFVAVDRYIAIIYPLRYSEIITTNRLFRAVICMWIFAVLFSTIGFYLPYNGLPILWIIGSFLTFLLPLGVLLYCYFRIYLVAKAQSSRWKRQPTFERSAQVRAKELKNRKAAATFAIITGLFVALFLPTLVVNFVAISLKGRCHLMRLNIAWFWVAAISYTSSAINPWIYAIRMTNFKQAIKHLLFSV
ncbi:adenosine receptor A2a-like [Oculina patagonica]